MLSVATSQPHKNLLRLIEAFAIVRAANDRIRLVLVGGAGQAQAQLGAAVEEAGIGDAVSFTGWLGDRELDGVYAGAELFVYPSLCEGFGLPLLEAMERDVPVLSSRATSLPEVGGNAVAYVDAASVPELARELGRLLDDPARRAPARRGGSPGSSRVQPGARGARDARELRARAGLAIGLEHEVGAPRPGVEGRSFASEVAEPSRQRLVVRAPAPRAGERLDIERVDEQAGITRELLGRRPE